MKLGIDLDGCAYSFNEAWRISYCLKNHVDHCRFDPEVIQWNFYEHDDWGGLSLDEFLSVASWGVEHGIIFSYGQPIRGFVPVMRQLWKDGHELHIITAREFPGVNEQCQVQTRAWLERFGVPYESLTFSADKANPKTEIFIDDRDKNLDDLAAHGIRPVRMVQRWNEHVGNAYPAVYSWAEFREYVNHYRKVK